MKRAQTPAVIEADADGLSELERLILSEIDQLHRAGRPGRRARRRADADERRAERRPAAREAPEPPEPTDLGESRGGDALAADAGAVVEEFATWVEGRPDRDAVLTELWSRLFGEPAASPGGSAPASAAVAGA